MRGDGLGGGFVVSIVGCVQISRGATLYKVWPGHRKERSKGESIERREKGEREERERRGAKERDGRERGEGGAAFRLCVETRYKTAWP